MTTRHAGIDGLRPLKCYALYNCDTTQIVECSANHSHTRD